MIKFIIGEAPKIGDDFCFSLDDDIHTLDTEVENVFSFFCFHAVVCKLKFVLDD
jgi:hypothetical protein